MSFKISLAVSALALSLAMPAFADLRPINFEKASRPAKGFVVLPGYFFLRGRHEAQGGIDVIEHDVIGPSE